MRVRFDRVSVWNVVRGFTRSLLGAASTVANRVGAWLAGVELGRGCTFYGRTTFLKARDADIRVGDRCVFRSSARANLIGINRPCVITAHDAGRLGIGSSCGFSGTVIGCFSDIEIGNHVRCGANTLITDGDWHPDDPRVGPPAPVRIEDNVWLGVNVMVLKGVTIGRNSVIGAGSVVTRNIPANVIAAGNPCRVIRPLS